MGEFQIDRLRQRRRPTCAFRPVEPLEGRLLFATAPNDPLFGNDGQHANTDSALAWDLTTGSADLIVAVFDSGVDIFHPDLLPNIWTNPSETAGDGVDNDGNGFIDDVNGWDFVYDDNDPRPDIKIIDPNDSFEVQQFKREYNESNSHGTHVAGTLGATGNNGIGIAGQVWNVRILPVRVFEDETGAGNYPQDYIDAINYVTALKQAGANVVVTNSSLRTLEVLFNEGLENALRRAGEANILSVVAAGNESTDDDVGGFFPARSSLSQPSVLTVAATDRNDALAFFSNFGVESVQVAAPGVDILSTWPVAADEDGDGYNAISGTSMASPVVAGIAALVASYRPTASALEIKQAIMDGSERIPTLVRGGSLPPLVTTGGRVNAYGAVRAIDNVFRTADHSTHGDYAGKYGLQGSLPAPALYAALNVTGGELQAGGPVGVYRRSADNITVDVNLTDGLTHRVSLVMLGVDHFPRQQTVDLYDAATGLKIAATQTATMRGTEGTILSYDLTGHVRLVISKAAGNDSVLLHDVTFDSAPTTPATFAGADTDTKGRWRTRYGSEGAAVVGHHTSVPFASVTGATTQVVKAKTRKPEALELPGTNTKNRTVAYLATTTAMAIEADFTADGRSHRLSVYALDFDRQNRGQLFELTDVTSGTLLDRRVLEDFEAGAYLSWDVSGHVRLTVTRLTGPDAALSGIFLDAAPGEEVRYVGQDYSQGGDWTSDYGSVGAYIVGNHEENLHDQLPAVPAGVALSFPNSTTRIVDESSTRRGAVRKYNSTRDRIAAYRESFSNTQVNVNVTRALPARVSIYLADVDNRKRAALVRVLAAGSGAELARTEVVGFRDGVYVTFDVLGNVVIDVQNIAGPGRGAIVNAVFFD